MYLINFTVTKKKLCLNLHYNGANSYLFVNGIEIYKFKAKDSEIVASPLCLGNISKDWSTDNMKKMNNQACKVRPEVINVNSKEPVFYPFKTSRCSGSCNNINDPYAKIYVPDSVKGFKR